MPDNDESGTLTSCTHNTRGLLESHDVFVAHNLIVLLLTKS